MHGTVCSEFASYNFTCVVREACDLLDIRGTFDLVSAEANNATCPDDAMVCCHVDKVVECCRCLEIPFMCDFTHDTRLQVIDSVRANLAFK